MSKMFPDENENVVTNEHLVKMIDQVYSELRRLQGQVREQTDTIETIRHDAYMIRQRLEQQ